MKWDQLENIQYNGNVNIILPFKDKEYELSLKEWITAYKTLEFIRNNDIDIDKYGLQEFLKEQGLNNES